MYLNEFLGFVFILQHVDLLVVEANPRLLQDKLHGVCVRVEAKTNQLDPIVYGEVPWLSLKWVGLQTANDPHYLLFFLLLPKSHGTDSLQRSS
jgi:hypothetical protein